MWLTATALKGQDLAIAMVGGEPVHCTDASGAIVYTRAVQQLTDWATSSIDRITGKRLITINLSALGAKPKLLQLFVYAYECGHHLSGDVIAGEIFREADVNREKTADRIGIRLMRDQVHITRAQAAELAAVFQNNPPMFPFYLPGPKRAKWIRDCYATDDDDCDVSTSGSDAASADQKADSPVQTSQTSSPKQQSQQSSAQTTIEHQMSLDKALPTLADNSTSNFVFIRKVPGTNLTISIGYNGRIIRGYYVDGGKQLSFVAYPMHQGRDGLIEKSAYDDLVRQVTSILTGWKTHADNNTQDPAQHQLMTTYFTKDNKDIEVYLARADNGEFEVTLTVSAVTAKN